MDTGEVVTVLVDLIDPGPQVRFGRLDSTYVGELMEVIEILPPIHVRKVGDRFALVDGAHRLAAHRGQCRLTIRAVERDLSETEALEEAVRLNRHGMGLAIEERRAVAAELLRRVPEWSDRRIASSCGLSDKVVRDLRPGADDPHLDTREGPDGKRYPADRDAQRVLIVEAIARDPEASNRAIAKAIGCSAMTVIKVREEIDKIADGVPGADPAAPSAQPAAPAAADEDPGMPESDPEPPGGTPPVPPGGPDAKTLGDLYPDETYRINASKAAVKIYEAMSVLDPERLARVTPADERKSIADLADSMRTKADQLDAAIAAPILRSVQ